MLDMKEVENIVRQLEAAIANAGKTAEGWRAICIFAGVLHDSVRDGEFFLRDYLKRIAEVKEELNTTFWSLSEEIEDKE